MLSRLVHSLVSISFLTVEPLMLFMRKDAFKEVIKVIIIIPQDRLFQV